LSGVLLRPEAAYVVHERLHPRRPLRPGCRALLKGRTLPHLLCCRLRLAVMKMVVMELQSRAATTIFNPSQAA